MFRIPAATANVILIAPIGNNQSEDMESKLKKKYSLNFSNDTLSFRIKPYLIVSAISLSVSSVTFGSNHLNRTVYVLPMQGVFPASDMLSFLS
jgi:hypothetical protein